MVITRISMVCMCVYMGLIVDLYLRQNIWNSRIPNIGNTPLGKILMGLHFVTGLTCMVGYIVQPYLKRFIVAHKFLGVYLYINALVTLVCGIVYGIVFGTVGGIVMDTGLIGYGITIGVFLICAVTHIVFNHQTARFKKIHKLFSNIYCVLLYGSVIYRLQYIFVFLFGYAVPDALHTDLYYRPLDRVFVFTFYLVPLVFTLVYNYACYVKHRTAKIGLYIIATMINVLFGGLAIIGCLYYNR